jgi:hypothetical protein
MFRSPIRGKVVSQVLEQSMDSILSLKQAFHVHLLFEQPETEDERGLKILVVEFILYSLLGQTAFKTWAF